MRHGVHFQATHPHERVHVGPLRDRLKDVRAGQPEVARAVVMSDFKRPHPGALNVQVFHGLGDKNYNDNPLFLQKGRMPRLRTALNRALRIFRLPAPFLIPPRNPGRRESRYQIVNAYGPRMADRLEEFLDDVEITRFGHIALNERRTLRYDPDGPLVWLPTWDNRAYMGGPNMSSLGSFAHEVAIASKRVPIRVKYHPLTLLRNQDNAARQELDRAPAVEVLGGNDNPYDLLDGCRGVLTDTSSLAFEAYCMGLPVGLALPHGRKYEGLHQELAVRVSVLHSGRPDLLNWAEAPPRDQDPDWIRDLLDVPSPRRNDQFAEFLRQRST